MLKDHSTPIQSSNDKWIPQKKKDFALENKLYGFNCEGKNSNLLCESTVNYEYIHDEYMISFSFCFNSCMVS